MFRDSYTYKIMAIALLFQSTIGVSQTKKELLSDLNLNIGLTCFSNPFYSDKGINNVNSEMPLICKAGSLGLEFYNKKLDASIEARKVYWLGLSASNLLHDVSGWASYSQLGVTKYVKLNTNHKLGINLSHIWVAENNYSESYIHATIKPHLFIYSQFHTARAISLATSINLTENLHLDARANIYYYTRTDSIARGVNSNRLQFSLIYKINPLKNKK